MHNRIISRSEKFNYFILSKNKFILNFKYFHRTDYTNYCRTFLKDKIKSLEHKTVKVLENINKITPKKIQKPWLAG